MSRLRSISASTVILFAVQGFLPGLPGSVTVSSEQTQMTRSNEWNMTRISFDAARYPDAKDTLAPFDGDADFEVSEALGYLDLKTFVGNWLWSGSPGDNPADLYRDGTVDFRDFAVFACSWSEGRSCVAIIIDSDTYSGLASEVQRLGSDVEDDLQVRVFILPDDWSDIRRIKDVLIDKYNHDGLIGAILIGEIPTAYFEFQDSGAMPTDWYFEDLSDKFIDSDGDGKFEREYYAMETDITMRDIWTGRIKPPVGGSEGMTLLKDYFDRNHDYRTGSLTYSEKMLYFGSVAINQNDMNQADYNDLVDQIDEFTGLYESDDDVNSIYDTDLEVQKSAYLSELSNSYDFVFVNIHGSVTTQWLGSSVSVYHNEIRDARPQGLFNVLASCSNGDFTRDNYLAGWHLFSGNSLVVMANSTVAMLVGATSVEFLRDYIPLGLGVTFGDMHRNDLSSLPVHLFGDPTLTLRPKPTGDLPALRLDMSSIDFGEVERGTKPQRYIVFTNKGNVQLKVSFKKGRFSIDGEAVILGYWDVFYYKHPDTGYLFRDFEVAPGQSKAVPFVFYPRSDGPSGRYSMVILFQTNDPENAYLRIRLVGDAL